MNTNDEQIQGENQGKSIKSQIIILIVLLAMIGVVVFANISKRPAQSSANTKNGLPSLIEVGSTECMPCKMMQPIIDELRDTYKGKINVVFVNVKTNAAEAQKYGVDKIPTQIFLDSKGNELERHVGFIPRDGILAILAKHEINLSRTGNVN